MKRIIIYCSLIVLCVYSAQAQNYTLSGQLKDAETGEDLVYANVFVEGTTIGVNSNVYGFYSLTLPAGEHTIVYSYIGYDSKIINIKLTANRIHHIEISPTGNLLEEIVITAIVEEDANVKNTELSVVSLDIAKTKKIPVLFGEKDIFKTLQLMPGVAGSTEGGSGFFVRGGATDQNLVLLDEAPVYNASHLLGFFSVFNSDALKDVKLYKGGIPAKYGGRASSVLDIRMKEGNMKKYNISGGIGLISSRLTLEGPIVKDKSSIIVSARRTYADAVAGIVSDQFDGANLYFYDLNAKANFKIGDKDRIYLSSYFGRDVLGILDFGLDWGNQTFTARWNHTINSKLFLNTSLIYSDYDYGFDIAAGDVKYNLSAGIFDYNIKQDFNYYLNPNNKISFGWQSNLHQLKPSTFTLENEAPYEENIGNVQDALESGIYGSNEQKIGTKFTLNYGLRLSMFNNIGIHTEQIFNDEDEVIEEIRHEKGEFYNNYFGIEPRISSTYLLSNKSSIKASYNRNYQYLHLLQNSNSGTPTDVWIPSSPLVKPILADQVAVGYFQNFLNNNYKFSLELYYKDLKNIVDYEDGAETSGADNIESELVFGKGNSRGVELLFEKTKGNFTGWISYTLSKVKYKSELVNNGAWYSARQNRTHDISIVGIYELSNRISLTGSWVYYTGDAVTFPSGKYFIDGTLVNLYTERNADRMPDYHRLDLGLTWVVSDKKRFYSDLNFSIYNVYNRKNAYSITFNRNSLGENEATRLALFGIIPSITWNFKF